MSGATVKARIENLMKSLLQVHKSLLLFQKAAFEKQEGTVLTPYGAWQLSMAHPDFEWLRLLSSMIIRMDDATSGKDVPGEDAYRQFADELNAIFNDPAQHGFFKQRLQAGLENNPELHAQIAQLNSQIRQ